MTGVEKLRRWATAAPTPASPLKNPLLTETVVLPGADGVIAVASAAAAAMPRRVSFVRSLRRVLIALMSPIEAAPRSVSEAVARLPPPSEVTTRTGPLWAARLADDATPLIV